MLARIRQQWALRRAVSLLQQERWEAAEAAYRGAIERDPREAWAHSNLAITLLKQARWEEAATAARRAVILNPELEQAHEHFGVALLKLERWDEAVQSGGRALSSFPDNVGLLSQCGIACSKLQRWEEAVEYYRRAGELAPGNLQLLKGLGLAQFQMHEWAAAASTLRTLLAASPDDQEVSALLCRAVTNEKEPPASAPALDGPGSASVLHLEKALEFLRHEHWEEAVAVLSEGEAMAPKDASFPFLLVDPLVRLGRPQQAAAVYRRAMQLGGELPARPSDDVMALLEERSRRFWSRENLGSEVFEVERWLGELASVTPNPDDEQHAAAEQGGLLFVLDNDYGELTTLKYLLLGRELAGRSTLLLPERLFAKNAGALPGRTREYESLADILDQIDRQRPDTVFLCSAYLFTIHELLTFEELTELVQAVRQRGCKLVTTDPFLGLLSKREPSALVCIDIPDDSPDRLRRKKQVEDERLIAQFTQIERLLRDAQHLYPVFCDVPEEKATETDERNLSFFNDRLIRPVQTSAGSSDKPHWLFILSQTDYDTQLLFEGFTEFLDRVACMLLDALAAGRHPIMVGPNEFIRALSGRIPTTEGIDILSYCPFDRLIALSLSAEHVIYWNVLSHSVLIRLMNGMPVVVFEKGHLVRNVPAIYERVIEWYYQGFEPTFSDPRQPLTLERLAADTEVLRRAGDEILAGYRRAPEPEALIEQLDRA